MHLCFGLNPCLQGEILNGLQLSHDNRFFFAYVQVRTSTSFVFDKNIFRMGYNLLGFILSKR